MYSAGQRLAGAAGGIRLSLLGREWKANKGSRRWIPGGLDGVRMKRSLVVTILTIGLAGGLAIVSAQSQNSSSNAKDSTSKNGRSEGSTAQKAKLKPLYPNGQGCNYDALQGSSGVLVSTGFCPQSFQKQFSITGPALMIGKNAYYFGYHTDAEARIVADVFCQRAGGQVINHAGGSVFSGGFNLNNFKYADSNFAVQTFDPKSNRDLTLNILAGTLCQRLP